MGRISSQTVVIILTSTGVISVFYIDFLLPCPWNRFVRTSILWISTERGRLMRIIKLRLTEVFTAFIFPQTSVNFFSCSSSNFWINRRSWNFWRCYLYGLFGTFFDDVRWREVFGAKKSGENIWWWRRRQLRGRRHELLRLMRKREILGGRWCFLISHGVIMFLHHFSDILDRAHWGRGIVICSLGMHAIGRYWTWVLIAVLWISAPEIHLVSFKIWAWMILINYRPIILSIGGRKRWKKLNKMNHKVEIISYQCSSRHEAVEFFQNFLLYQESHMDFLLPHCHVSQSSLWLVVNKKDVLVSAVLNEIVLAEDLL